MPVYRTGSEAGHFGAVNLVTEICVTDECLGAAGQRLSVEHGKVELAIYG